MKRIDAALVSLVITEYNAEGRPITECQTSTLKVFVSALKELPEQIEKLNAQLNGEQ